MNSAKMIWIILFVVPIIGQAKQKEDITITGTVSEHWLKNKDGRLRIIAYTEMVTGADSNLNEVYTVSPVNGKFKIVITPKSNLIFIQPLFGPGEINTKYFLVKSGSNIRFDLRALPKNFHVKDELLKCQFKVNSFFDKLGAIDDIQSLNQQRKEFLSYLNEILTDHNAIGERATDLLRLNYTSQFYSRVLMLISRRVTVKQTNLDTTKQQFAKFIINKAEENAPVNDVWLIRNSIFYVRFLYDLEQLYTKIQSANTSTDLFTLTYTRIQKNYVGILREKLCTLFFLRTNNHSAAYLDTLENYATIVHDPLYKKILTELKSSKKLGNAAYPFKLESNTNKIFTLADFKGKLIVCKFWFAGCTPCIALEKLLKPLKAKYSDSNKVVFISINVDIDKSVWQSGMKSEKYTSSPDLMLSTYGLGTSHPMLSFYKYSGFPQLLLIDKNGKIITSNPQRPVDAASLDRFENLLQQHL